MRHGFIKAAAGTPKIRVGDCDYNAKSIIEMMEKASEADVLVLPELCVTGYTAGDLLTHPALLNSAKDALIRIAKSSGRTLTAVGVPLLNSGKVYNCAALMQNGTIIGVSVKSCLPDYGEYCESRYFARAPKALTFINIGEWEVLFGTGLVFDAGEGFRVGVEIGEDLFGAVQPSAKMAAEGAVIILNPSASSETVESERQRRLFVKSQSARLCCAYILSGAGQGESSTDLMFSGHNIIAEGGDVLIESKPFACDEPLIMTEIDIHRLAYERLSKNTFETKICDTVVRFEAAKRETRLTRDISKLPFVPKEGAERDANLERILQIQSHGLKKRLQHIGGAKAVMGISGGLDSTLALLVSVRAAKLMGKPAKDMVYAVTMPCFGTSKRTRDNAQRLCDALDVPLSCVDITQSVTQHFKDIGQPLDSMDAAYENAQARERTQVLMDIGNRIGGILIGTGDLSELALGWATYGGDHMAMYGVNGSIPKTLARYLVKYCADTANNKELKAVLEDILDTPVSPELLPANSGEIAQKTENIIGPYELHDFFLYHFIRYGAPPDKIKRLAEYAFKDCYDADVIARWLKLFLERFFSQQFKRSCMPDGVGAGPVSLSPRAGYKLPSDVSWGIWP